MGPRPDDGAVVDASGRVHCTDRLSAVDASIVPNGPLGPYLTNQAYRENAGALGMPHGCRVIAVLPRVP
jgi:GMC oxidoreductase